MSSSGPSVTAFRTADSHEVPHVQPDTRRCYYCNSAEHLLRNCDKKPKNTKLKAADKVSHVTLSSVPAHKAITSTFDCFKYCGDYAIRPAHLVLKLPIMNNHTFADRLNYLSSLHGVVLRSNLLYRMMYATACCRWIGCNVTTLVGILILTC